MKCTASILPIAMACLLGSIYVLPRAGETAQSAVVMDLPGSMGAWQFENLAPSVAETSTLPKDTEFSKAICWSARPGEMTLDGKAIPDRIDFSIVLSGSDLNSSIHRPERCMPAQGHNILSSSVVQIDLPRDRSFPARRLKSVQSLPGKDGKIAAEFQCVTYYFFVGHNRITHDHFERTMIDMKDRLVHGLDQRWAYVSVSMWYGKIPWIDFEVTEEEADRKLLDYIRQMADRQIRWDQVHP